MNLSKSDDGCIAINKYALYRNTKTVGITSLGLEHTQLLGDTIEKIAWQKSGVIKPGANVFTVQQPPGCEDVIKSRADERNVSEMHAIPG